MTNDAGNDFGTAADLADGGIEAALRSTLHARASTVAATPEFDDVMRRAARRHHARLRAAVATAAVLAVAGPAGGFVAARAVHDSGTPVAAVGGQGTGSADRTAPNVSASGNGLISPSQTVNGASGASSSGVTRWDGPYIHVFTRTTDTGITMRVYRNTGPMMHPLPVCPDTASCPTPREPWVTVELSTGSAVGTATTLLDAAPERPVPATTSPVVVGSGLFGVAEGSPVEYVIVRVDQSARSVSADFDTGHDSMTPVGGIAVLAAPVHAVTTPCSSPPAVSITVTGADGDQRLTAGGAARNGNKVLQPTIGCAPVPAPTPPPTAVPGTPCSPPACTTPTTSTAVPSTQCSPPARAPSTGPASPGAAPCQVEGSGSSVPSPADNPAVAPG